jgi:hypothetical protein
MVADVVSVAVRDVTPKGMATSAGRSAAGVPQPQQDPRSEDQAPINIGDADYNPLFPYGWGCARTSPRGESVSTARTARETSGSA